ncbi:MAG: hypothetical protein ABIE94_02610 [archaeon]
MNYEMIEVDQEQVSLEELTLDEPLELPPIDKDDHVLREILKQITHQERMEQAQKEELPQEEIKKAIEEASQEETDDYFYYNKKTKKGVVGVVYYSSAKSKEKEDEMYMYSVLPMGAVIRRVPQQVLGEHVLGRAWLFSHVIEILDTLHGSDFEEVKRHEILHLQYPLNTERQIRDMTRASMPYECKYQ